MAPPPSPTDEPPTAPVASDARRATAAVACGGPAGTASARRCTAGAAMRAAAERPTAPLRAPERDTAPHTVYGDIYVAAQQQNATCTALQPAASLGSHPVICLLQSAAAREHRGRSSAAAVAEAAEVPPDDRTGEGSKQSRERASMDTCAVALRQPSAAGSQALLTGQSRAAALQMEAGGEMSERATLLSPRRQLPRSATATVERPPQPNLTTGMLWYAASSVFISAMGAAAKALGDRGYPVHEVMLARAFVMTPISLWALRSSGASMAGTRRGLLLLRGTAGYASLACYVLACQHLPLADATTFTFLSPLVAAALSPLLLRERPGAATAAVIPACLVGVLLITQPSFVFRGRGGAALSRVGVTFGLLHPFASAAAKMCVRALTATEPLDVMVLYLMACTAFYSTIGCIAVRGSLVTPSSLAEIALLATQGLLGYGNQVCITRGLANGRAAAVMSMQYLAIVVSQVTGMLVFREFTDPLGLAGMVVVVGSMAAYVAWETRRGRAGGSAEAKP